MSLVESMSEEYFKPPYIGNDVPITITSTKTNALDVQIDGDHYKKQPIQPVELAYYVNGTPCFCKLAKYLTRDKGDKLVNIKKALHCIGLERDLKGFIDLSLTSNNHKYWINKFSE